MRMMTTKIAMLVFAIFLTLAPTGAWAYSYGDANTEDVAETFKLVVSAVGKSPVDWDGALAAHKERRSEIAAHFGEPVAATLDADLKEHKAAETIANYKAVLIMNLDRRFDNAVQSIADYAKAKLLLAKARATYEALAPYAESKLSAAKQDGLSADFDAALKAIGNPGLFGVGKKDSDEAALKTAVNQIYGTLKPLFPYTPYKAPAKPSAGSGTAAGTTGGGKGATDAGAGTAAKPPAGSNDGGSKPATKPGSTEADAPDAVKDEPSKDNAAPPTDTSAGNGAQAGDAPADNKPSEEASADAPPSAPDDTAGPADAGGTAANEPAAGNAPADTADNADNSSVSDAATDAAVQAAEPDTIDGTKVHAAMDREDKTNPAVTIGVIAGVVVIGGCAVFWARRKGFF
ncbi:hypothetical protein [Paenibacillus sacheonensis]|uniref:Uncharacterized protein n=1 Tax=Paenibacillus sacheonensis TaxID=742054 RepID=A0A7X4YVS6_9BACL|nr:hypothetical protein [Paenibacillus sacheonensis]MBM7566528.1 hypothetical protein [Paenibacillus sacheonensis]NBC73463.1 hypothetical protein [Paenibacillus sacheonensis]